MAFRPWALCFPGTRCAEGLLNRVQRDGPGRGQPLADAGFWDDWCAQVHAQAAEQGDGLPVFQIGRPAAAAPLSGADTETTASADEGEAVGIESAAFAEAGEGADQPQADETTSAPADADEVGQAGEGEPAAKPRRRGKVKA